MGMKVGEKPMVIGNGPKKVVRISGIIVKGRIQKPEAFYVLPRTNLNGDSFAKIETGNSLDKIVKSLQDPHFDK